MTTTRLVVVAGLCGGLVLLGMGASVSAYLKLGAQAGPSVVGIKWAQMPVRYFITNRDVPGVTAVDLQAAIGRAFGTWSAVPAINVSTQFVGFSSAEPGVFDGVSVLGFQSRPELDRTLGATMFHVDATSGLLLEADIFLNSAFVWSVAPAGAPQRFDVQSIITHEIGHFLGLSHSALGETDLLPGGGRAVIAKQAVMFPIAFPAGTIIDRALDEDDRAGITDIYAVPPASQRFGQIAGRVTLNGQGLFGAHVIAFNSATGALVAGFSLDDTGHFVIGGLAPGMYVVRAEPLDDADLTSFFDSSVTVNVDFSPTFYTGLVAVPAGGAGSAIEIKVQGK